MHSEEPESGTWRAEALRAAAESAGFRSKSSVLPRKPKSCPSGSNLCTVRTQDAGTDFE